MPKYLKKRHDNKTKFFKKKEKCDSLCRKNQRLSKDINNKRWLNETKYTEERDEERWEYFYSYDFGDDYFDKVFARPIQPTYYDGNRPLNDLHPWMRKEFTKDQPKSSKLRFPSCKDVPNKSLQPKIVCAIPVLDQLYGHNGRSNSIERYKIQKEYCEKKKKENALIDWNYMDRWHYTPIKLTCTPRSPAVNSICMYIKGVPIIYLFSDHTTDVIQDQICTVLRKGFRYVRVTEFFSIIRQYLLTENKQSFDLIHAFFFP